MRWRLLAFSLLALFCTLAFLSSFPSQAFAIALCSDDPNVRQAIFQGVMGNFLASGVSGGSTYLFYKASFEVDEGLRDFGQGDKLILQYGADANGEGGGGVFSSAA